MPATEQESVLRWTRCGLVNARDEPAAALLVADSWLVQDGFARAGARHWKRFEGWCREAGFDDGAAVACFREAVAATLPLDGRWFPRVELTADGALRLRVRAAPPAAEGVGVAVAVAPDPRAQPRRKGPDLDLLLALRARTSAGELLLCGEDGALREGALSSLLWWEGDTLWTTPDEHTLPGVTRGLLADIARERGVQLAVRSPQPGELAGLETWLTSSLHGIRPVAFWLSPLQPAGVADRAADWQALLERHDR